VSVTKTGISTPPFGRPPEGVVGGLVPIDDAAGGVGGHDGLACGGEQAGLEADRVLRLLADGDVAEVGDDHAHARLVHEVGGDLLDPPLLSGRDDHPELGHDVVAQVRDAPEVGDHPVVVGRVDHVEPVAADQLVGGRAHDALRRRADPHDRAVLAEEHDEVVRVGHDRVGHRTRGAELGDQARLGVG
jgi:hypothetical protein